MSLKKDILHYIAMPPYYCIKTFVTEIKTSLKLT